MTQPIPIPIDFDVSGTQQVTDAANQLDTLQTALNDVSFAAAPAQKALGAVTPSRLTLAAWGGAATAAALYQQQLSGIDAKARVTGQSQAQLSAGVKQLARDFPIGISGAVQATAAVQALGLSSSQQVPQIRALSREFVQLGGATGESIPALATSFGQLNRQLASLDPSRVGRFGDVLTTVSAQTGASASGIVSFAQSIAPMAQQAGLGESAVLGISGAFAKLGDDGYSAGTAVNKILTDMNQSVREGSNQLTNYSQLVGMTASQFRKLYVANPAGALTRVTNAIANAGPQGQYQLENLGLDGVRTQRALLELANSGGLGQSISTAVGAYGNGSTAKAAATAFSSLDDTLTKVRTSTGELAATLGAPLLTPLNAVTGVFNKMLHPVIALAGTRGVQDTLSTLAYVGIAGAGIRRLVRPATSLALFRQAATSGPIVSAIAGAQFERYGPADAMVRDTRMGRFARGQLETAILGNPMGRGPMNWINQRAFEYGQGFGRTRADLAASMGGLRSSGGTLRNALRATLVAGSLGTEGYSRFLRDPMHQALIPAAERSSLLAAEPEGPFSTFGKSASAALKSGDSAAMTEAYRSLRTELGGTGTALRRLGGSARAVGVDLAKFGGSMIGMGGRFAGKGLSQFFGGPIGLGITGAAVGGYLGYKMYSDSKTANQNRTADADPSQMYSIINQYRDSLGTAGVAAVDLAQQLKDATTSIASTVHTYPQARTVTPVDTAAWGLPDSSKVIHAYNGTNKQIASQISTAFAGVGMTPPEMQAVAHDLYNQNYAPSQISSILRRVNTSSSSAIGTGQISDLLSVAGADTGTSKASIGGLIKEGLYGAATGNMDPWTSTGTRGGGAPQIGTAGKTALTTLAKGILQSTEANMQSGGPKYAIGQEINMANAALAKALKTHNADLVVATEQTLTRALTGHAIGGLSAADIARDQSLSGVINASGATINGKTVTEWINAGVGIAQPTRTTPVNVMALRAHHATTLSRFFSGDQAVVPYVTDTVTNDAVSKALSSPMDLKARTTAIDDLVHGATKAGESLSKLAGEAVHGLGAFGPDSTGYALMQGVLGRVQFLEQGKEQQMTLPQQWASQTRIGIQLAQTNGKSDAAQQARDQGQSILQNLQGAQISFMQARVMAQRQYEINTARENFDYNRQLLRQEQDFNLQRLRATEDFQLQETRSRQDYQLQTFRSVRDFNINVSREVLSANQQAFGGPFQRIQAKPVFDATNLLGNLREQNQAMSTQKADLHKLRQAGISNAVVRSLDLTNTDNYQQVQQILDDISNNPALINQINNAVSRRSKTAGALFKDSGNAAFKQQRQDLNTQLSDSRFDFNRAQNRATVDFHTQMSRDATDFNTQLGREAQDFNTELARQAQDLHHQDQMITGNMKTLQKDLIKILHGQQVDWSHTLVSGLKQTEKEVRKHGAAIASTLASVSTAGSAGNAAAPHGSITGTPPGGFHRVGGTGLNAGYLVSNSSRPGTDTDTMGNAPMGWGKNIAKAPKHVSGNAAIAKRMAAARGWTGVEWDALYQIWQQESGFSTSAGSIAAAYGIPQSDPGDKMSSEGADWRTNPVTQIRWGLGHVYSTYGDPLGAWIHKNRTGWYAQGGIAMKPHFGVVAEAGNPEAMIPLNQRGVKMLAAAMRQYMGEGDARFLAQGGRSHAVFIDHSQHHYDSRVQFPHAKIEVMADDPLEFGRKTEAKARMDNLAGMNPVRSN